MSEILRSTASTRTLNILAAIVWYVGGIVLLWKGSSLLVEANELRPELSWPWLAVGLGLVIGGLKAMFLFSKSCQKNLSRITSLDNPKFWQFFRPRFLFFLAGIKILQPQIVRHLVQFAFAFNPSV